LPPISSLLHTVGDCFFFFFPFFFVLCCQFFSPPPLGGGWGGRMAAAPFFQRNLSTRFPPPLFFFFPRGKGSFFDLIDSRLLANVFPKRGAFFGWGRNWLVKYPPSSPPFFLAIFFPSSDQISFSFLGTGLFFRPWGSPLFFLKPKLESFFSWRRVVPSFPNDRDLALSLFSPFRH